MTETLTLSVSDILVSEADGYAEFVVRLNAPATANVSVQYNTDAGTASSVTDYTSLSGTLNFAPGVTTQTVRVALDDDSSAELVESMFLKLYNPSTNARIANNYAQATIVDDDNKVSDTNGNSALDAAEKANLSVRDVVVDEKAGIATFDVVLSKATTESFSVAYSTGGGTATAGSDYAANSGTLSFAAGQTTQRVSVSITDDTTAENAELLNLTLGSLSGSGASQVVVADKVGTAFIGGNDQSPMSTPTLSVSDILVSEADGYAEFVVRLNAPATANVSVQYNTDAGTASSVTDYTSLSGTLNFAPGVTTQTVRVALDDDSSAELVESMFLKLYNPSTNARIANNYAQATIVDDDSGLEVLRYGDGDDIYSITSSKQSVVENFMGGVDTVLSHLSSYTLGSNVENGRIMSTGAANLSGNSLNNVIDAGKGSNVMAGGSGTDTLSYAYGVNGTTGVKVSLATTSAQATGGSGTDTISGFERLTGSANNDNLTGDSGANLIRGGSGNDTVIGGGGNDTLYGDAGNDLLRGGTGKDTLDGGSGIDTADFSDKAGAVVATLNGATTASVSVAGIVEDSLKNIENLTGGSAADKLTGDGLANTLIGNAGNDTLNGKGGADLMLGGSGNDTYYVDNTGDRAFETTTATGTLDAGGIDTIISYLTAYTLGDFVENGRIMSTGAANLSGNGLNNVIDAGKGSNVMAGGSGTDTLSYAYGTNGTAGVNVSLATTSAQATGGSGTDTLSGFENLTGSANSDSLTGNSAANLIRGGNGNDTVTGGSGNDTLYGDAGNDLLRGGTGNDILYGGVGKDIFRFDTALGTSTTPNIDTIKDFSVLDDTIQLENAIFRSFGTKTGVIGTGNFKANLTGRATDSNDYIIYETDTGKVFYDADGSGAVASVQIALVGTGLALSSADFVLV